MYSKVKLFGHPLHPMLIVFPIAFYTLTFVAFVIYGIFGARLWFQLGTVVNWAGVLTAAAAAVPGYIDWRDGIPSRSAAKQVGRQHLRFNAAAWGVFLLCALVQSTQWGTAAPGAAAGIILSAIGLMLTIAAGRLGWSLIQKHHVGVDLTPEQERLEPAWHDGQRPAPRPFREKEPSQGPDHPPRPDA